MSAQTWHETLITSQVDGSTLTAAARASCIPAAAKYTLPANFFKNIGQQLKIYMAGRISTVVTTPGTARIDVSFGGTIIFDGLAVALATADAYTTQPWDLEITLTLRALGATGNLMGNGRWSLPNVAGVTATPPKGAQNAMLPWNTAPVVGANFDTTTSQQVDVFFTQTVATGSFTVHQYALIALN